MVLAPDNTRPPVNPKKKKEEHGKDHGHSSWRHGERDRVTERVTITLNPYEQDANLSTRPSQVRDAIVELCSRTLILGKRMASDLMKRDKNATELDSLHSLLEEPVANLQLTLDGNNDLLAKNQNLEAEMNNWKNLHANAERARKELAAKADKEI